MMPVLESPDVSTNISGIPFFHKPYIYMFGVYHIWRYISQVKPPYISHLSLEEVPALLEKFDTGDIRGRAIVKME